MKILKILVFFVIALIIYGCSNTTNPSDENIVDALICNTYTHSFNEAILLVYPDGTGAKVLTANLDVDCSDGLLSPDGKKVLFVYDMTRLVEMDLKTMLLDTLFINDQWLMTPSYHPNGTSIVFSNNTGFCYNIAMINRDGSNYRHLTSDTLSDKSPSFNKNGDKIIFQRDNKSIFTINPDGTGLILIKEGNDTLEYDDPCFTPDGKILFTRSHLFNMKDIYVMNGDGTNEINLTKETNASDDYFPSCNLQGNKIAFTKGDAGVTFVGSFNGTAISNLVNIHPEIAVGCIRARYGRLDKSYLAK
jgi:Tol biopolymer transport system component